VLIKKGEMKIGKKGVNSPDTSAGKILMSKGGLVRGERREDGARSVLGGWVKIVLTKSSRLERKMLGGWERGGNERSPGKLKVDGRETDCIGVLSLTRGLTLRGDPLRSHRSRRALFYEGGGKGKRRLNKKIVLGFTEPGDGVIFLQLEEIGGGEIPGI